MREGWLQHEEKEDQEQKEEEEEEKREGGKERGERVPHKSERKVNIASKRLKQSVALFSRVCLAFSQFLTFLLWMVRGRPLSLPLPLPPSLPLATHSSARPRFR